MPHESSHPSSETIRLMRTMRAEGATIGKIAQRFSLTLDETRRHVDADEQDKQVKSTNAPPTILTVFQNRTVKAPSSPEQAIAWLREVATHLETYPYASNSFRFTAQAIREFLSGKNPSLEHALKLNKKRGVPGNPESRRRMAVTVHQLKKSGKSKREIQEALEQQGHLDIDWSTVKRTYNEHKEDLEAEDRSNDLQREYLQELSKKPRG